MPVHFTLKGKHLLWAMTYGGRTQNLPSGLVLSSEDTRINLSYEGDCISGKTAVRIGSGNWLILQILRDRLEDQGDFCSFALIANESSEGQYTLNFFPRTLQGEELIAEQLYQRIRKDRDWEETLCFFPETDFREWSEDWHSRWTSSYIDKAMEATNIWLETHREN